jgi:oligopeptide/dipeptide ABC transporter ATP-binding protein
MTQFHTAKGIAKAVDGISFSVPEGKTVGIVGESGCGKSVTALSIMRLIAPPGRIVSGEILFHGQDLLLLSETEMREIRGNRISMIFQEPMSSLNPVHRIGDQIAEAIRLHKPTSRRKASETAVEMLSRVGIPDPGKRAHQYPHQMSGGMRQRVMIAMALACDPDLIIADEPTTALDVTIQAQILDLMNRLRKDTRTSILLITHDLGLVAENAHSVIIMYAGRIVEQAPVIELFREPRHPYTIGLMASVPKIDAERKQDGMLHPIPGVVPSLFELLPGCAFGERCGRSSERCRQEDPPLRQVAGDHLVRCWDCA